MKRRLYFREVMIVLVLIAFMFSISLINNIYFPPSYEKIILNDLDGKEVEYEILADNSIPQRNKLLLLTAEEVAENSIDNIRINTEIDFDDFYKDIIPFLKEQYTTKKDAEYLSNEYIQSFQELLKNDYKGDCDDYALFFYVLAKKLDLEARYVSGMSSDKAHTWIQINKNGTWYEYDSTSYEICEDCISKKYEFVEFIK